MWRLITSFLVWIIVIEAVSGTDHMQDLKEFPETSEFTRGVYKAFGQGIKSVILSPFSMCSSLVQTALLASGQTAFELLVALGLKFVPLKELQNLYESRNRELLNEFYKSGTSFLDPMVMFANGSDVIFLDSISQLIPQPTLEDVIEEDTVITSEVAQKYIEIRTDDIVHIRASPASLGPNTLLAVNAMVVRAEWQQLFYRYKTYKHRFLSQTPHGFVNAKVDMMTDVRTLLWKPDKKLQVDVLELPFRGGELVFFIVLPHERHGLQDVEQVLMNHGDVLASLSVGLSPTLVRLGLPRFRLETSVNMKVTLEKLGIVTAFNPAMANFSHISETGTLYLSDFIHAAAIEINEEGISPSAETSPLKFGNPSGVIPPDQSFIVDHPFLFFVRHNTRLLLSGKYLGP